MNTQRPSIFEDERRQERSSMLEEISGLMESWMKGFLRNHMNDLITCQVQHKVQECLASHQIMLIDRKKEHEEEFSQEVGQEQYEQEKRQGEEYQNEEKQETSLTINEEMMMNKIKKLEHSHKILVKRVNDLEKERKKDFDFKKGQIRYLQQQEAIIRELTQKNAELEQHLSGHIKLDLQYWKQNGYPNHQRVNQLRYGLKPIESIDKENIKLIGSELQIKCKPVKWEKSILDRNEWRVSIKSIGSISSGQPEFMIGICDKKQIKIQLNHAYSQNSKNSIFGGGRQNMQVYQNHHMPQQRLIGYLNNGDIMHWKTKMKTILPSFSTGDIVKMEVDPERGIIRWSINGEQTAFYKSEDIKQNAGDWVPFVLASNCTAKIELLTQYC